jgi:biotin-(acetyl-CoA carboxylase) ligase
MATNKPYPRQKLGNFVKHKANEDGTPSDKAPYIKIGKGVNLTLAEGDFLAIESKAWQLSSLEKAHSAGKVNGDSYEKLREKIEQIPDWVVAEVVKYNYSNN